MLDRLNSALVDSYVGAVALGYMLALCVLHFANFLPIQSLDR
jgi:hypothetical protein